MDKEQLDLIETYVKNGGALTNADEILELCAEVRRLREIRGSLRLELDATEHVRVRDNGMLLDRAGKAERERDEARAELSSINDALEEAGWDECDDGLSLVERARRVLKERDEARAKIEVRRLGRLEDEAGSAAMREALEQANRHGPESASAWIDEGGVYDKIEAALASDAGARVLARLRAGSEREVKTFFMAWMDSRHFDWKAFGETPEEAKEALIDGWNYLARGNDNMLSFRKYAESFGVTYEEFVDGSVCVAEFEIGQAYRDHERIRPKRKRKAKS